MAIVNFKEALLSVKTIKKFSFPNGFGKIVFGESQFGHDEARAGVYRSRKGVDGRIIIKNAFMYPANPQSIPQQANRVDFANAIAGWQFLTDEQKLVYNKRAVGKHMSGYNLYIQEYMKSH